MTKWAVRLLPDGGTNSCNSGDEAYRLAREVVLPTGTSCEILRLDDGWRVVETLHAPIAVHHREDGAEFAACRVYAKSMTRFTTHAATADWGQVTCTDCWAARR